MIDPPKISLITVLGTFLMYDFSEIHLNIICTQHIADKHSSFRDGLLTINYITSFISLGRFWSSVLTIVKFSIAVV